jgi:hypothetical protein
VFEAEVFLVEVSALGQPVFELAGALTTFMRATIRGDTGEVNGRGER